MTQIGEGVYTAIPASAPEPASMESSTESTCTKPRIFLVIHCHPGWNYDLGNALKNSALTHEKEIKSNAFPNLPLPSFSQGLDTVRVIYCNNIDGGPVGGLPTDRNGQGRDDDTINKYTKSLRTIIEDCQDDSLVYVSIFTHSGWLQTTTTYESALFFHPTSEPWANFTGSNTSLLTPSKFTAKSQVRIFGCYAGYGSNSIAKQISDHLPQTDAYAYNWHGGSFGTNDKDIGHGRKIVPPNPPPPKNGDTWFVTFSPGKTSSFQKF